MTDESLIALFVRPLNQLGIPYMVTGGVVLTESLTPHRE
jgi:hypothetical protein